MSTKSVASKTSQPLPSSNRNAGSNTSATWTPLLSDPASAGQQFAVRTERHPPHPVGVSGERLSVRFAALHIPQLYRFINAGTSQKIAVRTEVHRDHLFGVTVERLTSRLSGLYSPKAH